MQGTRRRDRDGETILIGGRGAPDRPSVMSSAAADRWDLEVPKMAEAGLLDRCDGLVLAQYFEAISLAEAAAKQMGDSDSGPLQWLPNDFTGEIKPVRHPAFSVWKDAVQTARLIASEYGFTPSSRTSLGKGGTKGSSPTQPVDRPERFVPKTIEGGKAQ